LPTASPHVLKRAGFFIPAPSFNFSLLTFKAVALAFFYFYSPL